MQYCRVLRNAESRLVHNIGRPPLHLRSAVFLGGLVMSLKSSALSLSNRHQFSSFAAYARGTGLVSISTLSLVRSLSLSLSLSLPLHPPVFSLPAEAQAKERNTWLTW